MRSAIRFISAPELAGPATRKSERTEATMRRWATGVAMLALFTGGAGCEDDGFFLVGDPAPPVNLQAQYFNQAVHISWDLSSSWNGESFRVYGKRLSDPQYFLIAEVTNCTGGQCSYTDVNIVEGVSYEYYVSAVDPDSGVETASANSVVVDVPSVTAPPTPAGVRVIALDDAAYVVWEANARASNDFSYYRVYLEEGQDVFLLGETDSEGFLDLLIPNGNTATYSVASVDVNGHESGLSAPASGTPRPDFHGEWVYVYQDQPTISGFRFQEFDDTDPLVDGDDPDRHFRLEADAQGWWLVAGPGTEIHAQGFATTSLKCGVAADPGCVSLDVAPSTGYTTSDVGVFDQTTYPMRVRGNDGQSHYGAIRVQLLGADQDGNGIMIFDWAYQLQAGNANLSPVARTPRIR